VKATHLKGLGWRRKF